MVFHRFLESNEINIYVQNRKLDYWDPYLKGLYGCQPFAEEYSGDGKIRIKGYVLPHKTKISFEDYKKAEGPKGWNEQQGFYIYRNKRLILAGNWLNFFRAEPHYNLARIIIDLPNNLDNDWQIDIKKSSATPPIIIKEQLKAYAKNIRQKAVEVYRHKGAVLKRKHKSFNFQPVWEERKRHDKRFYKINKKHPIIKDFIDNYTGDKTKLSELFRLIGETVPIPLIAIKENEEPDSFCKPYESITHEEIKIRIQEIFHTLMKRGDTEDEVALKLLQIEPFNNYPEYIEFIKNE